MDIDIEQIWSAGLGFLALTVTHLAGSRRISAWVVGMVSQCGWLGFMIYTGNWGFLVSFIGFTVVYIRNYRAWKRTAAPAAAGTAAGDQEPAAERPDIDDPTHVRPSRASDRPVLAGLLPRRRASRRENPRADRLEHLLLVAQPSGRLVEVPQRHLAAVPDDEPARRP